MAKEMSREGHRKRVKEQYIKTGISGMRDENILELILFYAIPRRDVKQIVYNLMNYFNGDLRRILNADVDELMKVEGVGENASILLNLFGSVNGLMMAKKNENVTNIESFVVLKEYVYNLLALQENENVIVITADNNLNLINCKTVANGTVNCANVEPKQIVECAIKDNAPVLVIAHNHPNGSYNPSEADVTFTRSMYLLLKSVNIHLYDHIIVGDNGALSMQNDIRYCECFM